jgi:hypothetical protein
VDAVTGAAGAGVAGWVTALAVMAAATVAGVMAADAMGVRDALVVMVAAAAAMRRVIGLPM